MDESEVFMAQVSISEAAKLTGKSRRTIQRYVATGKLSMSQSGTTGKSIDTSELIRVFGTIKQVDVTASATDDDVTMSHHDTLNNDKKELENQLLQQQVALLKQRLEDKESHIESLKSAMLLIELKLSINNKEKSSWLDNVISKLWKK